jgi:hypothetical protein
MQRCHDRRGVRDHADEVVRRAEFLLPADRALLLAVYADGRSVREVATLMREDPRRLRRRVRNLARRVLSNDFIFVLRHRDGWPSVRRRVATACVVHGRTLKQGAADSGTSFYNARKQLDAVRALLDSIMSTRGGTGSGVRGLAEGGSHVSIAAGSRDV